MSGGRVERIRCALGWACAVLIVATAVLLVALLGSNDTAGTAVQVTAPLAWVTGLFALDPDNDDGGW